jgi:hypothetical protein
MGFGRIKHRQWRNSAISAMNKGGKTRMDDAEFASIDPSFRQMKRAQLEAVVVGVPPGLSLDYVNRVAQAKAEVVRRDREFAEEQERSRRKFEADRDSDREKHDLKMFKASGEREAARQQFEEKLSRRQMDHASALAREQLDTAGFGEGRQNGRLGSGSGGSRGDRSDCRRSVEIAGAKWDFARNTENRQAGRRQSSPPIDRSVQQGHVDPKSPITLLL